jgi:hypothetical protein
MIALIFHRAHHDKEPAASCGVSNPGSEAGFSRALAGKELISLLLYSIISMIWTTNEMNIEST